MWSKSTAGAKNIFYHVCDIGSDNVNNWLYSKDDGFHPPDNVKKVNITVNFSIAIRCTTTMQNCVEHFDVYTYQATKYSNKSDFDPGNGKYDKLSTVKFPSNLSSESVIPWSTVQLSLFIKEGTSEVFLSIHDQGACLQINSVLVTYSVCPKRTLPDSLVVLPQTLAPTDESETVKVVGECTDHSESTSLELEAICKSNGDWLRAENGTGVCLCKPGWEKVAAQCQECKVGYFKDKFGNTECTECPLNSVTETVERKYCKCKRGFFLATWEKITDNCTAVPSKPRHLRNLGVDQTTVSLSWTHPHYSGGRRDVYYEIECKVVCQKEQTSCSQGCGSQVVFLPRQRNLSHTKVTVAKLFPATAYRLRIYAKNGVSAAAEEEGVPSEFAELEISTLESVSTSSNPNLSPIEVLSKEATVALSVAGAILFLCIVLGFAFIRHQRKQIVEYRNQFFPVYTGKHQIDPNRTLLEQCNDLPYDPDFEFPEDKLILGELLGSGAFGKVIKAEAIGINNFSPRDKSQKKSQRRPKMFRQHRAGHAYHDPRGSAYTKTTVAVKTVKGGATKEEVRDLASELKILIYVGEHKNIVNLLGVCIKRDRILVILEYAPHGSLQKFLRSKRDIYEATWITTASDPEIGLNISNLVNYSYQISRGMEYLASKKCVHRDLAARNVLVGEDYVMKIADFGLARDIYKSDLYVRTNSGVLPVKWMAIESLFLREYSEKSDVWSFGICLWEIFTLGGTPYPTIPVEELLDFLNDGNRMENPRECPSEIYKIMQDCWQEGPDKRPKFDQISELIGTILEQRASQSVATEYLHLTEDNNRGKKDYYLDPHDSDPTVPVTRADVYDRRSSENIANNPLPPLPGDMEDQFDPESEERRQMLKPEIYGGLSGSEDDIELEEFHGNEQAVALELTPIAHSTEKAGNSKKKTAIV